jgi:hypothetical protein
MAMLLFARRFRRRTALKEANHSPVSIAKAAGPVGWLMQWL